MFLEVMFSNREFESFVGLCSLDLENKTFSPHHFHNRFKKKFDFTRFFENLKYGWIDYFKKINYVCLTMFIILFQSFISIDTLEHF